MIRTIPTALALLSIWACSSTPEQKYPSGEHRLASLVLYNLQARRPVTPGADPKAEPGEPGWKTTPLPDQRLDCRPIRELFASVDAAALSQCLQSLQKGQALVEYELKRETQPYLALEGEEKAPPCLKTLLPRIPVPREIVFQAEEEKHLRCFASRLDIEADRVLGVRLPVNAYHLKIQFPLGRLPARQGDLQLLLATWAVTPFFQGEPREVLAKLVPDAACTKCFQGSKLYKDWEVPGFWPEDPARGPELE